jgi:phospholipase C
VTRLGQPGRLCLMQSFELESLEPRQLMAAALPRPQHIIIVVEENHSFDEIIGSPDAQFINSLAKKGALFTHSSGVTHPSQPNYLALFAGSTKGVTDDACPQTLGGANLATTLAHAHLSFAGFSEDLPATGSAVCSSNDYFRKHNPWVNFANVPASANRPLSAFKAPLPTVSFVIPNQAHDMHDGTVAQADSFLKDQLAHYAQWAKTHNSLLIVTWDEDDNTPDNHIPTIIFGDHVKTGKYSNPINHFNVLRTIEDMYKLPRLGASAAAKPITTCWK